MTLRLVFKHNKSILNSLVAPGVLPSNMREPRKAAHHAPSNLPGLALADERHALVHVHKLPGCVDGEPGPRAARDVEYQHHRRIECRFLWTVRITHAATALTVPERAGWENNRDGISCRLRGCRSARHWCIWRGI
jgi:hypothetical protein